VRVEWQDHHWVVLAGNRQLKDFGRREADARLAARLIHALGLTQRGTVGQPAVVMEYWLANGAAPSGSAQGLHFLQIDLPSLRVELIQAQWCLRDDLRILFNFGTHPDEARRALAIIQKYRFTQLGALGMAAPSMMVFLAGDDGGDGQLSPSRVHKTSAKQAAAVANRPPDRMFGSVVTTALPPLHEGDTLLRPAHLGGPRDKASTSRRPAAAAGETEGNYVPFDWRQLQVRHEATWELVAGNHVLASFSDERTAQQALAVVQHYRLTEHCLVGQPKTLFSYFLTAGQAPRGQLFGLHGVAFQTDHLTVERLGSQWAICEGDRVLVILGTEVEEARALLATIQRMRFDCLAWVGPPQTGMSVLLRTH
jgi:hypothetical protein